MNEILLMNTWEKNYIANRHLSIALFIEIVEIHPDSCVSRLVLVAAEVVREKAAKNQNNHYCKYYKKNGGVGQNHAFLFILLNFTRKRSCIESIIIVVAKGF